MNVLKKVARTCSGPLMTFTLLVTLVACAGGGKPASFYMLRSMENPSESLSSAQDKHLSVLLGPVTLPAYLDRDQMVTLEGKNKIALDEFNRWSESLRDSFYRVLQEDLSLLLKTPGIYTYDKSGSNAYDYQVIIHVTRFDGTPDGDAVLTAFWTIKCRDGGIPGIARKSVFRAPISTSGFSGMVQGLNQALSLFSREIASAIDSLAH